MINVTHDCDNRATRLDVLIVNHLVSVDLLDHVCCYVLGSKTELLCHKVDCLGVKALVDGHEESERHTGSDDLIHRHIHHHSEVIRGHELGQFEHFRLLLCLHALEFLFLAFLLTTLALIL